MTEDAPMLPMPGLEIQTPPLRTFTVEWRMSGTFTVHATSAAIARTEAAQLNPQRLALYSNAVSLEIGEPKEVQGE